MYVETLAALAAGQERYASFSAIGGLGGADISYRDMVAMIERLCQIQDQPGEYDTCWLMKD